MLKRNRNLIRGLPGKEAIYFRYNGKRECISIQNIVYIESDRVYSIIIFTGDDFKSRKLCHSIRVFEEQLNDYGFIRCHRSYLVNLNKVINFCSRTRIISSPRGNLPISVRKSTRIFSVLLEKGIKEVREQIR
jgi:two-component system, LytTR family, response regulator LytT